jgi:hypothetical protein
MYTAFTVSVFFDDPNFVYMGDASVQAFDRNGVEIHAHNSPVTFSINNERPLYEVQGALLPADCAVAEAIPFVAWDPSNIYFVSLNQTRINVMLFSEVFT